MVNRPMKPTCAMPMSRGSPFLESLSVSIMATAYRIAESMHSPSPRPKLNLPERRVREPTPMRVSPAQNSAFLQGSFLCSSASISGTITIAVFSRKEVVEARVCLRAKSSAAIIAEKAPPIAIPMSSVLRFIRLIRLKNMAQSITKARQKRTESMFSGLMVASTALDSNREVLRATMTPARSSSAGFAR